MRILAITFPSIFVSGLSEKSGTILTLRSLYFTTLSIALTAGNITEQQYPYLIAVSAASSPATWTFNVNSVTVMRLNRSFNVSVASLVNLNYRLQIA